MPVDTKIFAYGQTELEYLTNADQALGAAIRRLGRIERMVIPDLFAALVHAIVGQQISAKAADTVWRRMQERIGAITPDALAAAAMADIQQCGMSNRKAGYIKNIAESVIQNHFDFSGLARLTDSEVIKRLAAFRGVGVWTAEMLLLNSMERPDIVSWGDMAIRRGMMNLYGLDSVTKSQFDHYKQRYSPYGSVASIYLWQLSFNR